MLFILFHLYFGSKAKYVFICNYFCIFVNYSVNFRTNIIYYKFNNRINILRAKHFIETNLTKFHETLILLSTLLVKFMIFSTINLFL